jgi:two-component system response regulator FlrC
MKDGTAPARVLVVEDNPTVRDGLEQILRRAGHEVVAVQDGSTALRHCLEGPVDLVITDFKMEGMTGLQLLEELRRQSVPGDPEVMLITAYGTIDIAVEAMKLGAVDFITKPFDTSEFKVKVEKALATRAIKRERDAFKAQAEYLREEVEHHFGEIVGRSAAMRGIYESIRKVAEATSSVYIYGESGTGKELIARAIHRESARAEGPFVKVNCSALAEGLLESELFGHEKGAFTGAIRERKGRFELAHEGTLFLDEISDIPLSTQVKLLRVLQEKRFERVGGRRTIEADVRWMAATNRDLGTMLESGALREDLYHRLAVFPVRLPPLRERREDILPLAETLLERIAAELGRSRPVLTKDAAAVLEQAPWPGNIRQLRNTLERAMILDDDGRITADLLRPEIAAAPAAALDDGRPRTLEQLEQEAIRDALRRHQGHRQRTADELGIGLRTLYDKLKHYGLG